MNKHSQNDIEFEVRSFFFMFIFLFVYTRILFWHLTYNYSYQPLFLQLETDVTLYLDI